MSLLITRGYLDNYAICFWYFLNSHTYCFYSCTFLAILFKKMMYYCCFVTFTGSFIRNKRPSSTGMGFKTNLALAMTSRAAVSASQNWMKVLPWHTIIIKKCQVNPFTFISVVDYIYNVSLHHWTWWGNYHQSIPRKYSLQCKCLLFPACLIDHSCIMNSKKCSVFLICRPMKLS